VRVAALYDIHGNLPALEAVLADVGDEHAIVVGGDVAAGPWPSETLARLHSEGDRVHWLRGNADRELTAPSVEREGGAPPQVMQWVRSRMSADELVFLSSLPLTVTLDVEGLGGVLFCHATPRDDDELLTSISPDERWASALAGVEEPTVVCGHTHMQFERTVGEVCVVNAGSVGMAYERQDGAYWLELGPGVRHRRTAYDTTAATKAMAAAGWPDEWPTASPEEATEFFERASRARD
jgi:predicted phosphodiesterase